MKVLFATDGSESAIRAHKLVASIAWPSPTELRVLHVDQPFVDPLVLSVDLYIVAQEQMRAELQRELEATKSALAGPGRDVETLVKVGRPASTIVDEARAMSADLVVLGSHGRGALAATVLGSVAAEVVDHAPCSVLVARGDRVTGVSLSLAHDGSPVALQTEEVVLAWPFLRALPVHVVSAWTVAPATSPRIPRVAQSSAASSTRSCSMRRAIRARSSRTRPLCVCARPASWQSPRSSKHRLPRESRHRQDRPT